MPILTGVLCFQYYAELNSNSVLINNNNNNERLWRLKPQIFISKSEQARIINNITNLVSHLVIPFVTNYTYLESCSNVSSTPAKLGHVTPSALVTSGQSISGVAIPFSTPN